MEFNQIGDRNSNDPVLVYSLDISIQNGEKKRKENEKKKKHHIHSPSDVDF